MLSTLPREILLMIAAHLINPRDILNLALCTHGFYALLHHHAFTTLVLRDHDLHQLSRFTDVLARNPRCAQAVRVLRFDPDPEPLPMREGDLTKYDRAVILPVLEKSGFSSTAVARWENELQDKMDIDAWIAVLLSLVHLNVEELAVTFYWPSFYVRKLLAKSFEAAEAGGGATFFPRLRELSARWWDDENGVPSSYILPFFRLPSLRIFNGEMIQDGRPSDADDLRKEVPLSYEEYYDERLLEEPDYETDPEGYFAHYPGDENFSNVTHIRLTYSSSEKGFPDLIRSCRSLVSFAYEHGNCASSMYLAPRRFYDSLRRHKRSLEELEICYDRWAEGWGDELESEFIGSFGDFAALKRLRLRWENLLLPSDGEGGAVTKGAANIPMEALPLSLESLTIEEYDKCDNPKDFMAQLRGLRSALKSQCPDLSSLRVIVTGEDMPPQEDGWPLYSAPSPGVHGTRRAAELVASTVENISIPKGHWECFDVSIINREW
ncbi:hypothetical protein BJY01DRAFT_244280 [Aspergillus pseudoustus]|uniref:Leucine-rich repeat domain-containing protein n=1 Tax=Aspergillus pseudoustus TaxID=1810923 RepID=A0ABR4KM07_9EURO